MKYNFFKNSILDKDNNDDDDGGYIHVSSKQAQMDPVEFLQSVYEFKSIRVEFIRV